MIRVTGHERSNKHLSDYIPWAAIVAPGVIMQKDGIFQSSFEVVGYNFVSMHANKIEHIVSAMNNMCTHLESGWSMFVEAVRTLHDISLHMRWNANEHNSIAKYIEQNRMDYYKDNPLFEMKYFITFCFQKSETEKKVRRFFSDTEYSLEHALQEFQKTLKDIEGMLKECFEQVTMLDDNATMSYLHSCVSHNRQSVLAPPTTMYIDAFITDEPLVIEETLQLGDRVLGILSVHDFPHATRADILEDLQVLALDFRWQSRMIFISETQAIQDIKRYRKKHYAQRKGLFKIMQEQKSGEEGLENTEAIMRALDADQALELAGKNKVRFGYFTSVIVLSDTHIDALRKKIDVVKEVFQKKGFIIKEESLNAMDAWLSSLPGNVYSNVRRALIHSVNVSHILPLSSRGKGITYNSHLARVCGNGSPHILANAHSNVYYINLNNESDVGHTFIVGPTGAGKSILLGMLCVQFLRYPHARVAIFDKDFSALALTKAIGGLYFAPGEQKGSVAFQPFRGVDNLEERRWAIQYCVQILVLHDIEVSGDMQEEITHSCGLLGDLPIEQRTFSSLYDIIQDPTIKSIFSKYCSTDMLGSLFNGVENSAKVPTWVMYEMGYLMKMGKDAVIPALMYLFHTLENSFDGSPTLLILDEGWLFLQHQSFAEQFKVWLKTLRKKHVFVVMATQEIADAVRSPLLETIVSACQTKIYLPDRSADQAYMKDLYFNFGLNEQELFLVSHAQPKREYYIKTAVGSMLCSLDLSKEVLEVFTNTEHIPKDSMSLEVQEVV